MRIDIEKEGVIIKCSYCEYKGVYYSCLVGKTCLHCNKGELIKKVLE